MLVRPTIVHRDKQPYMGRRESVTMTDFGEIADHLPGMFGWLNGRGVAATGAPFFRYRLIDMSARLVVEAGIPVAAPVEEEGPIFAGVLPEGRYARLSHVGPPDSLMGATGTLLDWAQRQELRWDMVPTPEGEEWGCRLELLMTNPAEEPDISKWETVLLFRLAD